MPNLKPFRDYNEHDVINLFACDMEATKGTLVKPVTSWKDKNGSDISSEGPISLSSDAPGEKYTNTINNLFNIVGSVTPTVNSNDTPGPIGILLYDVREKDENGNKLIFNPRKMAEMNVVLPKIHAVPILTKGLIYINDIQIVSSISPSIGASAYAGSDGKIATNGYVIIGKFLSKVDENGYCLVKLNM